MDQNSKEFQEERERAKARYENRLKLQRRRLERVTEKLKAADLTETPKPKTPVKLPRI